MNVSLEIIQEALKEATATKLTGFDANIADHFVEGVALRIHHAIENGEKASPELITAAIQHWHISSQKYYQDVLDNKDGLKDRLMSNVYEQLKSK